MASTETIAAPEPQGQPEAIKAVPVRHPGRWVTAALVALLAVIIVHSIATNPRFEWGVVGDYLFDSTLNGVLRSARIATDLLRGLLDSSSPLELAWPVVTTP